MALRAPKTMGTFMSWGHIWDVRFSPDIFFKCHRVPNHYFSAYRLKDGAESALCSNISIVPDLEPLFYSVFYFQCSVYDFWYMLSLNFQTTIKPPPRNRHLSNFTTKSNKIASRLNYFTSFDQSQFFFLHTI